MHYTLRVPLLLALLLEGNTFADSSGARLSLDGASASLSGHTYEVSSTDLTRPARGATDTPEDLDDEPRDATELCPDYDHLTRDIVLNIYLSESEAEL